MVIRVPDKRYCFVVYTTIEAAEKAMKLLGHDPIKEYDNNRLYIKYAEEDDNLTTNNSNNTGISVEPEDCNITDDIIVPGFYLFNDFIDNETEEILYNYFSQEGIVY